ncbi:hypothetical protein ACF0H5_002535 [Mactra antiquata]
MSKHHVRSSSQSLPTVPGTKIYYLVFLVIVTVLNISFFLGFGNYTYHVQCSTDTIVEVLSLYIAKNGEATLRNLMPQQCSATGDETESKLKNSITGLIDTCRITQRETEVDLRVKSKPTVTLITTFADHLHADGEKIIVHNNTLVNWAKFRPFVKLVLFSNDTFWIKIAKSHGWDVIPVADGNDGKKPPVLKEMMQSAMNLHKTQWYGYINADILLTSDLISNIVSLSKKYDVSKTRILFTGRRTNVNNFTTIDPTSDKSIRYHANRFGSLYTEDAEDFFITTKTFPWDKILPVVIGRPGYDNWLVGESRCKLNTTVIDVTETFLALHQTTLKGGNSEGHFHEGGDYNIKLLKKNDVVPNFLAGLTDCIYFKTYYTFCDIVEISQRHEFGPACACNKAKPKR